MIEVRLFATFRENRDKIIYFDPSKIKNVNEILNELQINQKDLAICLVNGFHSSCDTIVKDLDVISLFPPVGGG